MKKLTVSLFIYLTVGLPLMGDIIVVDVAGGGDYIRINDAVGAAHSGDTILVMSGTYYLNEQSGGAITVDKRLYIIGSGFMPPDNGGSYLVDLYNGLFIFESSANNSVVKGFRMLADHDQAIKINSGSRNITFEKNIVIFNQYYYGVTNWWTLIINDSQNDTIRDNIFVGTEISEGYGRVSAIKVSSYSQGLVISNNLIAQAESGIYLENTSSIKVHNNIFLQVTHGYPIGVYGASDEIYSNIFMNCDWLIYVNSGSPTVSNNDFYNITYENVGTKGYDYLEADPQFINFTSSDIYTETSFDEDNFDFHLSASSPCIDAGVVYPEYNDVDGSRNDIGLYGGPWPFDDGQGAPTIPEVLSISVSPTQVSPGGTLTLTATGRIGGGSVLLLRTPKPTPTIRLPIRGRPENQFPIDPKGQKLPSALPEPEQNSNSKR